MNIRSSSDSKFTSCSEKTSKIEGEKYSVSVSETLVF